MESAQLMQVDDAINTWLATLDDIIPKLINDMVTTTKQNRFDLVTNVDKMIQQNFERFLNEHFPNHQLFAEEKSNDDINAKQGHVWIMDPIDGTTNLVKQQEDYCIILGYFVDGEPILSYIYDYPHGQLYKAIKGYGAYVNGKSLQEPEMLELKDAIVSYNPLVINDDTISDLNAATFGYRCIGSCGLDSMRVVKGQFGAHVNTNPKPWDIAAQFLFASELGLKMTTLDNEPLDFSTAGPFIISNKGCHADMLAILNAGDGYKKY
ncbi:inositol monophosphatase family protein [Staphylococcus caeli]|uniref:inositol monophosphatase family protein n=1 Tax=Staphylococcus caeli TaxID=2201815 RepID=UPI003F576990